MLTEQVFWHAVGGHTSASNTEARGAQAPGTDARRLIGTVLRRRKKLQRRAKRLGDRLYSGQAARYRS
jgi:hypothetical protein